MILSGFTSHLLKIVSDLFPSRSLLPFWGLSAFFPPSPHRTWRERTHAVYYLQSITASGKTHRAGGVHRQPPRSLRMPRIVRSQNSCFAPNSGQKPAGAIKGKLSFMSGSRSGPAGPSGLNTSGGTADGAARASHLAIKGRITTPKTSAGYYYS